MEAIVAAPAPVPPQHTKTTHAEQGDSDSTFAPTLTEALSKKNAAKRNDGSTDEKPPRSLKNTGEKVHTGRSEEEGSDDEQVLVATPEAADAQRLQKSNDSLFGNGATLSQIHQPHGAHGNTSPAKSQGGQLYLATAPENTLPPVAKADDILLALKNTVAAKNTFKGETLGHRPAGERSFNESSSSKTLTAPVTVAAAMTGNLHMQGAPSQAMGPKNWQKPLEMLQQTDTVAWSRLRADMPKNFGQQPFAVTFAEDDLVTPLPQTPVSTEQLLAGLSRVGDRNGPISLRNGEQISIRQAIGGQFLAAKLETADAGGEQKNTQQFLDGESNPARHLFSTAAAKTAESTVESSFSQNLHQTGGDKVSQTSAESLKPGPLPFTSVVSENEILRQVAHKFKISTHLQDSKITMRLHPAELGNLKIDIQLKDGTLNANIVAQTRQVHEILEKNMPRLRALMEQQGLEVGEIVIRVDAETPSEHNLFDEQLAGHTSFSGQDGTQPGTVFSLDDDVEEEETVEQLQDTGVNVKI